MCSTTIPPVAVQPYVPCGECESCRAGVPQLCKTMGASMLGVFADGGMADEVVVDPSCLSPLPAGVRVEDASLVEPLAVSLHACNRVGIEPGMRVGVVGAGTIGLLSALVAQHLGAEVHVTARHDSQRVALEKLGIAADGGRNCDTVIEAAGTASAFDDAVRRCRRGGTVVARVDDVEPDRDLVPRRPDARDHARARVHVRARAR